MLPLQPAARVIHCKHFWTLSANICVVGQKLILDNSLELFCVCSKTTNAWKISMVTTTARTMLFTYTCSRSSIRRVSPHSWLLPIQAQLNRYCFYNLRYIICCTPDLTFMIHLFSEFNGKAARIRTWFRPDTSVVVFDLPCCFSNNILWTKICWWKRFFLSSKLCNSCFRCYILVIRSILPTFAFFVFWNQSGTEQLCCSSGKC